MLDVHDRFMRDLEAAGRLDRTIEALPDTDVIAERRQAGHGLTQPELAVVLAYSKITLYASLLDSDLPEDPALEGELASTSRRRCPSASATRSPAPAEAGDHRHAGGQRPRRPRGDDVHVPPARGHGRVARRHRARLAWSRATCSTCARCGRRSRRSTAPSPPTRRRDAACRAADGRTRDALAAAHAAAAAGHRRRGRRASPTGARRAPSCCRACSSSPSRRRGASASAGSPTRACRRRSPAASPRRARCSPRSTSSRSRARPSAAVEEVAALHFQLGGGCTCTGCATRSRCCRATPAGRRWRAPRCATTSSRLHADLTRDVLRYGVARRLVRGQPGRGRARAGDPGRDPRGRCLRPHDAAGRAARGAQPDRCRAGRT